MKAWVLHDFGDFRLEERPEPVPPEGYALLRVRTVQLSVVEAMLARGTPTYHWAHVRERLDREGPSQFFGHEFCGEVLAINGEAHGLKVGDRVAGKAFAPCGLCRVCAGGRPDACQRGPIIGFAYPGALAELCVAATASMVPIPAAVDDCAAATLQPSTDAVAGVVAAGIRPGDTVAVLGFGCTGIVCAEVARARGAGRVVVSEVRDEALALAQRLGYEVVDARAEDIARRVDQTADVAFDCAGGPVEEGLSGEATHEQGAACLRDNGMLVGISLLGEGTPLRYDVFRHRALRFTFPVVCDGPLLRETVDLMATGKLRIREAVSHVLDGLERVPEAVEMTCEKARFGATNPAQIRLVPG